MPTLRKQRFDSLSPVVEEVVSEILRGGNVVTPLDVLQRLEIVERDQVAIWQSGGLPYLERGITTGLSRVARVLRLIHDQCLTLGLAPIPGKYRLRGKGPARPLRFSKRGDAESEKLYATHFVKR